MNENSETSFQDFIAVVKPRRKIVTIGIFVGGIVAVIATFVIPKAYDITSAVLLVTPDTGSSVVAQALGGTQASPLTILQGVAESRTTEDYVVKRTGIDREELQRDFSAKPDVDKNVLVLTANGSNVKLLTEVIQVTLDCLYEQNRRIGFSTAEKQADSLSRAVTEKERELSQAENDMVTLQQRSKTHVNVLTGMGGGNTGGISPGSGPDSTGGATSGGFGGAGGGAIQPLDYLGQLDSYKFALGSVDRQLKQARQIAHVSATASSTLPTGLPITTAWRVKLEEAEYNLRLAEQKFGPLAPDVVYLKRSVAVVKQQLATEIAQYLKSVDTSADVSIAQLEAQRQLLQWDVDYISKFAKVAPTETLSMVRAFREVSIRQAVLTALRADYEKAKVASEVDRVRWTVMDKPYRSDKPTNFRPVRNFFIGAIIGLILMVLYAYWNGYKEQKQGTAVAA